MIWLNAILFGNIHNKEKIDNGIEYKNKEEMVAFGRVVAWNKLIKKDVIK